MWWRTLIIVSAALVACFASSLFWNFALESEDLTMVMAFITGAPIGLISFHVWSEWADV